MMMTDPVQQELIQQELMKLLGTVSRELVSISNTFYEIIAIVEGESEQEIGLNPPKPVRWGKTDPADYGKPSTRLITEQEALAHADQRIIEGYAPPLTFELDSAATIALDDDSDPNEGRYDRED